MKLCNQIKEVSRAFEKMYQEVCPEDNDYTISVRYDSQENMLNVYFGNDEGWSMMATLNENNGYRIYKPGYPAKINIGAGVLFL